ncbi:MAG: hypothetical protein WDZ45_06995 [Flavobacteriaceae bacterium]
MALKAMLLLIAASFFNFNSFAQIDLSSAQSPKKDFWEQVSFGGGLGLSIGSGYFSGGISPGAVYNFNQYVSAGLGLTYNYLSDKRSNPDYKSTAYGGSVITLFHPIREIQLSAELEGIQVDRTFLFTDGEVKDDFFQEALFLGAGFRTGNLTMGVKYNILHDSNRSIYGSAFLPFVRVYF